jgi:hypothetical protein
MESSEPTGNGGWGKIIAIVVFTLIVVVGLVYGISYYFRQATVAVTPKIVSGAVTLNLNAVKGVSNPLSYEVVTFPETRTKVLTATHADNVTTKATGSVVIYNFQSVPQSLVATTRFADQNGQVFRLNTSVTVPKKSVVNSKNVPGQIVATLTADVAGIAGNIPLSDFTVVSFKGSAKEQLVYAKGKTTFTGGSSGSAYFLNDDDYNAASKALAADLVSGLQADIVKQVPDGYLLLPDSLAFVPDASANKNPGPMQTVSIPVTYTGSMRGVLLKKSELSGLVIKNVDPSETVDPALVAVTGIDGLTYKITKDISTGDLPQAIPLSISGNASVVWNIDKTAIAQALIGTPQARFTSLLQTFPSIKEAELSLVPFWIHTLPTSAAKIHITVAR